MFTLQKGDGSDRLRLHTHAPVTLRLRPIMCMQTISYDYTGIANVNCTIIEKLDYKEIPLYSAYANVIVIGFIIAAAAAIH